MKANAHDQLREFQADMRMLQDAGSEAMGPFVELHRATLTEGDLTAAQKELIAVAVAISRHCEECVVWHVSAALKAGATSQQVTEAADVAVMMGGGPAVAPAARAVRAAQELSR